MIHLFCVGRVAIYHCITRGCKLNTQCKADHFLVLPSNWIFPRNLFADKYRSPLTLFAVDSSCAWFIKSSFTWTCRVAIWTRLTYQSTLHFPQFLFYVYLAKKLTDGGFVSCSLGHHNIINLWLSTTRHVHITQHEERLQHSPGSCPLNPSIFIHQRRLSWCSYSLVDGGCLVYCWAEDDRGRVECVNTRSDGRAETKPKLVTSLKCPRTH